ncbi:MAG: hypothetical protein VX617_01700, partial [Pseudomonadota bacterium]|nr:hypothetical protein [Pseudomonadota bacterium]
VTSPDNTRKFKGRQNKGVRDAVKAFVSAVKTGGPAPVDELTSINNSIATISLLNSLRTGSRINL